MMFDRKLSNAIGDNANIVKTLISVVGTEEENAMKKIMSMNAIILLYE